MDVERITSRGRFREGSLTLGTAIECDLTADNYSFLTDSYIISLTICTEYVILILICTN